jgi:hypothetical protein
MALHGDFTWFKAMGWALHKFKPMGWDLKGVGFTLLIESTWSFAYLLLTREGPKFIAHSMALLSLFAQQTY